MNPIQKTLTPVAPSHDEVQSGESGQYDALILDAKFRLALASVRALGQRGVRIAALEVEDMAQIVPVFSSRWCQQAFVAPSYKHDPEPFVEYLERLLDNNKVRVLIPSADGTLAVIRQYRERLQRRTNIALAKEEALAVAVNKDRTLALAEELGIGVPRGVHVRSVSEVAAALHEVGLPVVIKPAKSWVWGDNHQGSRLSCKLAITLDEATRAVEKVILLGGSALIQQFLPGECESVSFLYANGEVYARFAHWAKRMEPPLGGMAVFRKSIAVPQDIGDQAERLVRAINLEGCCHVEFRRDAAGKPCLMEINPRLWGSVELAVHAGINFPHMLYQWASGERIDRVTDYRVGIWMRYLRGDVVRTIQSLAQRGRPGITPPIRAILEFFGAFFIPSYYDYFSWNDLRPSFTATREVSRGILQFLQKGDAEGYFNTVQIKIPHP